MPTGTISRCGGGSPALDYLTDLLLTSPDAVWKLDELAGSIAHDSLPGHHDANQVGGAPTWGSTVSPPGVTSVYFPTRRGFITPNPGYTPNLSGDFSAAIWVNRVSVATQTAMGQGDPVSTNPGWSIFLPGSSDFGRPHPQIYILGGGVAQVIVADASLVNGSWYFLVVTHAGTLWTMYVNGVAQSSTYSGAYTPALGLPIWIGWDNIETYAGADFNVSYATLWATRALSAGEVGGLYTAAVP